MIMKAHQVKCIAQYLIHFRKPQMTLLNSQKKNYKTIGHKLKPIVFIADNGLSENVVKELNRALDDHELIKIKINVDDRDLKASIIQEVCEQTNSVLIQSIGKTALLFRPAKQPNPKLSNLLRHGNLL